MLAQYQDRVPPYIYADYCLAMPLCGCVYEMTNKAKKSLIFLCFLFTEDAIPKPGFCLL
jgi:hypothetical protein